MVDWLVLIFGGIALGVLGILWIALIWFFTKFLIEEFREPYQSSGEKALLLVMSIFDVLLIIYPIIKVLEALQ